ncbi:type II toxin-antitoxin system RelE/ParE family toxin [Pantoea cypripedii]|uniref:Type II toxin-antitoxin system RelE/ParE family toxin n=1 Tax=Pantoea cypripedii TaxID=55209 RepID=A0A6B9G6C1_PANCY|nr:type II toxin-antitoxin system RelE/ParE family toxin [Pantoea cypripedii]QGY33134.1 type II toxin-antitoxin system RelE/ParE family toxin [Pantoea cypripedii]
MTTNIVWERRALTDREDIFLYLNKEAGALVAIAADDRLATMVDILKENPMAGVQVGRTLKHRKLVIPHFPFIVVYVADGNKVSILRVLHTSRKIAGQYSRS